ncbi:MAG: hypothetical protein WC809_11125 [Sinimarinibacterium sp.]|jgi:F-type H+-transporting ATPase subunit epsilon
MSSFSLHLCSATRRERIDGVTHFIGEDASGWFGLLPQHARLVTVLDYGLARYRTDAPEWHYVALPGAVLSFRSNHLSITTRRYLQGTDFERINQALEDELRADERRLGVLKDHLSRLEREMSRRLSRIARP